MVSPTQAHPLSLFPSFKLHGFLAFWLIFHTGYFQCALIILKIIIAVEVDFIFLNSPVTEDQQRFFVGFAAAVPYAQQIGMMFCHTLPFKNHLQNYSFLCIMNLKSKPGI
jgi:hypothetical protein